MKKGIGFIVSGLILILSSCSGMIKDFKNMHAGSPYTVISHFEDLIEGSSEYDRTLEKEEICYGITLSETEVVAEDIPGFTLAADIQQQIILEDGSTEVHVYYKRNMVSITFNPDTGIWEGGNSEPITYTRKYGTLLSKIELPELTKQNWKFVKWSPELPLSFPLENLELTAYWSQTAAEYTVEHRFENLDSTDYVMIDTPEILTGDLNQDTKAVALKVDGFTPQEIVQQKVKADGSTKVIVKYDRNIITLSFDGNGGSWTSPVLVRGKYGTAVTDPVLTLEKEDYTFVEWVPAIPATFPLLSGEHIAKWKKTGAPYTVKYYYEPVDSDIPVVDESKTKSIKGLIGAQTDVTADEISGFETPVVTQTTIKEDGSSVVTVKYSRNRVNVTLNPNGGTWDGGRTDSIQLNGKYGAAITGVPELTKEDYYFIRFGESGLPKTFPASDAQYDAFWSKSSAIYTVRHFFEAADSTNYIEDTDSKQTLKGAIDPDGLIKYQTTATALERDGFIPQPFNQATVKEDNSAEVKIYYNRKTTTLTFDGNGGSWKSPKTVTGKYGAKVKLPSTSDLTKEDYRFASWSPAIPADYTFPLENADFTATWEKVNAYYTIKCYFESADNDDFVIDPNYTTREKGEIGTRTNVTASAMEHYQTPVITQTTILDDDSAVVEVRYPREIITFTYKLDGGTINSSGSDISTSGKYGSEVTALDTSKLTKSGWIFTGWDKAEPKVYTANTVFTAKWTACLSSSNVQFSGKNDIELRCTQNGSNCTFEVAVPYSGNWKFEWFIDKVRSQKTTASITETLSTGVHKIMVIATEGGKIQFSKNESVTVQ